MKEYWKQHWFEYAFSAILVGLTAIGISIVFDCYYSTNDDAMLRSLVEGSYTGMTEAHLVYIMYPLGLLGKLFYTMAPNIFWYDIFMTGMHYLSWFLVLGRIGEQFRTGKSKTVSILVAYILLVVTDLQYIVLHQYSILAAWLVAVAVFFLITSKEETGSSYLTDRIVCMVFFLLGMWLRKQVFLLALPIVLMVLVLECLRAGKRLKEKKVICNKLAFVGVFAGLVLMSSGVEKLAYSNSAWQEFLVFNEARTDVYDYYGVPSYETAKDVYERLGFDYGDYIAIDRYNPELAENMIVSDMVELAETAGQSWKSAYSIKSIARIMVESVLKEIKNLVMQPVGMLLLFFYIALTLYCCKNKRFGELAGVVTMLLFQIAVIGYFSWRGRFPERISYGLYIMAAIYLFGMLLTFERSDKDNQIKNKLLPFFAVFVAGILFCIVGFGKMQFVINESESVSRNYKDWICVNDYFRQNATDRYCMDTKSFVFSTEKMFEKTTEADNIVRLGTWVQWSPLQLRHHEKIGMLQPTLMMADEEGYYYIQDSSVGTLWLENMWESKAMGLEPVITKTVTTPGGRVFEVICANDIGVER